MSQLLNLIDLEPGQQLDLADGAVVEVVENPRDGMWVFCRYLSSPENPALVDGEEHPVFAASILAVKPPSA